MTTDLTDGQRWATIHTEMAERADGLRQERDRLSQQNATLRYALRFATKYVAKAVADGLMEDCAVPASVALERLREALDGGQGG